MVEKKFLPNNEKFVPEPDKKERVAFGFPLQAVFYKQEEAWEEVFDFTKIKKGGVDIKDIFSHL